MENYFKPYNTFIFTAATFLDYDDKEHFPLVACAECGIIDDTICSYGNIITKVNDKKFNNTIKNQLMLGIEDNIKILENCLQYFYILPIRFLLTENDDAVAVGAESAFLSLFNVHFNNMEDYFHRVISFEDLEQFFDANYEKSIMLYKDDDVNLPLKNRINNYIEITRSDMDFDNQPMIYIFMTAVYSNIAQALDVILLCTKYKLIPYLRYNVAFLFFTNLIQNPDIAKIEHMDEIKIEAIACYIIYKVLNRGSLKYSDFKNFAVLSRKTNLYENVLDKVKQYGAHLSLNQIAEYANSELQILITNLHK